MLLIYITSVYIQYEFKIVCLMDKISTNLLVAATLSFELGAVTSANSQPVVAVPLTWLGAELVC